MRYRIKKPLGITLLEIMIAMSLMSVVIIAFATVFPSGYRLNLSNLNQGKAAGYASAICEQVANIDITSLTDIVEPGGAPRANDFNYKNGLIAAGRVRLPEGVRQTADGLQHNAFFLDKINIVRQAFTNTLGDALSTDILTNDRSYRAFQISATLAWTETKRNQGTIARTVNVTTLVSSQLGITQ